MSNARIWLFRILVLAAAGFMAATWFMPWWIADVVALEGNSNVIIHPWGLETHLGFAEVMVEKAKMPEWFAPLIFVFLGLCMIALLYGLWVQGKVFSIGRFKFNQSKLLIGGVGFLYIVIAVVGVIFAAIRTGDFWGLPLQGHINVELGEPMVSDVDTSLQIGYYLSYAAGILLIILATLRNKITGKS